MAPSFGLGGACWLLSVWDGLGSESLLRLVHSGLGSKQQHLGSMQQGGFGGQAGFGGQEGGFGGQQWSFGGQGGDFGGQMGFGGQEGGFGGQGGDFDGQQGDFGGHGLHFGSHIFRSFGCPRIKRRTFSEGTLAACIHPHPPKSVHPQRCDSDQGWHSRAGHPQGHSQFTILAFSYVSVLGPHLANEEQCDL